MCERYQQSVNCKTTNDNANKKYTWQEYKKTVRTKDAKWWCIQQVETRQTGNVYMHGNIIFVSNTSDAQMKQNVIKIFEEFCQEEEEDVFAEIVSFSV